MISNRPPIAGYRRVLLLHAHPDDETIASGHLIAAMISDGLAVAVLTATRGEQGEVVPGALPDGLDSAAVSVAREAELAAALVELGGPAHAFLGSPPALAAGAAPRRYADSGMRWETPERAGPAADASSDALTVAERDRVVADLAAMFDHFRPDLLITYDVTGGYGHPDHVLLHHAGVAAASAAGIAVAELMPAGSDKTGDYWIDLSEHREPMIRALRRHASQLTVDGDEIVHVGGQREAILDRVGLRLISAASSEQD